MSYDKCESSFNPDLYDISLGEHAGKEIIWMRFPYEPELVLMLRSNARARWSQSQKSWYIPHNYRNRLHGNLKPKNLGKIHPVNLPAFNAYQDRLVLNGFSANTIRTYTTEFAQLLYLLRFAKLLNSIVCFHASLLRENCTSENLYPYASWFFDSVDFLHFWQAYNVVNKHLSKMSLIQVRWKIEPFFSKQLLFKMAVNPKYTQVTNTSTVNSRSNKENNKSKSEDRTDDDMI